LFTFRGKIAVFIAFLNRSFWAVKECHLSLLKQTKIDQAKNQQSFTCFVYKNANKILKTRKAKFSDWQLSQVASTQGCVGHSTKSTKIKYDQQK
jgi:hypothetical protein